MFGAQHTDGHFLGWWNSSAANGIGNEEETQWKDADEGSEYVNDDGKNEIVNIDDEENEISNFGVEENKNSDFGVKENEIDSEEKESDGGEKESDGGEKESDGGKNESNGRKNEILHVHDEGNEISNTVDEGK